MIKIIKFATFSLFISRSCAALLSVIGRWGVYKKNTAYAFSMQGCLA